MALLQQMMPDPVRRAVNCWRYEHFQLGRKKSGSSLAAFDYYKCIFVHIPKTGGISVSEALWGHMGGVHKTMEEYRRIFGRDTLNEYFSFTFVRNPWARLVSAWSYLKAGGQHARDKAWAEKYLTPFPDFKSFVSDGLNENGVLNGIHFRPQTDFITLDGKIAVDFIGRQENLKTDFNTVRERIGLHHAELPHRNRSDHKNYREYYDDQTAERVEKIYQQDIVAFNYTY